MSREKKLPSCTMNGTKDGAKGHHEQDVDDFGIPMLWYVERRDASGVSREGSWCLQPEYVSDSGKGEGEKYHDRRQQK